MVIFFFCFSSLANSISLPNKQITTAEKTQNLMDEYYNPRHNKTKKNMTLIMELRNRDVW